MATISTKTFYLDGHTLVFRRESTSNVFELKFPLREVTKEELSKLRLEDKAGFVLKENGILYYTKLPEHFPQISSLEGIADKHLCGECPCTVTATCNKFLQGCKSIESHDFILWGFETFSACPTFKESFVVFTCKRFPSGEHTARRTDTKRFHEARLLLAQMYNHED